MSDMNANSSVMFEYDARAGETPSDALFLERLDTFMEKSLGDIRAFAERESRPYEETRRCIAQWHAKYLFQPPVDSSVPPRSAQVRSVLCNTSGILESLSETAGVQSFLLAIDPNDSSDAGFLGGSLIGREFWRGMRGGGDSGARLFKAFYTTHARTISKAVKKDERPISTPPPPKAKSTEGPARFLKTELYEAVRNALRTTSGIRNAEMKWTNPEKLDVYGVRLIGWPEGVPAQNPSTLKAGQNKLLHEAILSGTMRFEKLSGPHPSRSGEVGAKEEDGDTIDDFSWAYDVDARLPSPPPPEPLHSRASSPAQRPLAEATPTSLDASEPDAWTIDPIVEATLAPYNVEYPWGDEFSEGMMLEGEWGNEAEAEIERPRKRLRSEEPGSGTENSVSK